MFVSRLCCMAVYWGQNYTFSIMQFVHTMLLFHYCTRHSIFLYLHVSSIVQYIRIPIFNIYILHSQWVMVIFNIVMHTCNVHLSSCHVALWTCNVQMRLVYSVSNTFDMPNRIMLHPILFYCINAHFGDF